MMKKIITCGLMLSLMLVLIACGNSNQRSIQRQLQDLNSDLIANMIVTDEGTYRVFLSDSTPIFFNVLTTFHKHYIVLREHRSYAYLINEEDYSDIRNQVEKYTLNRLTHRLTHHKDDEDVHVTVTTGDDLIEALQVILQHKQIEGSIQPFDALYPIIESIFQGVSYKDLNFFGNKDYTISISYQSDAFFLEIPAFMSHLEAIYPSTIRQQIIDSMTVYNQRNTITVRINWDSNLGKIKPALHILVMNLDFYLINPFDENYQF